MTFRDRLGWLSFPMLMGGFVALAVWGLDRAIWDVLFAGPSDHSDRCPLGLEESPVPGGFLAQLGFPFRAQVRPPAPVSLAAGVPPAA